MNSNPCDVANTVNLIVVGLFGIYLMMAAGLFMLSKCRHNIVEVMRSHSDVVPVERRYKLLYTDVHEVSNFVRCCKCGEFLQGKQREKLFEAKKMEPSREI